MYKDPVAKRLSKIYHNMKTRCYNKNNVSYESYGGRGITVCKEWLEGFQAFKDWALENGYQDDLMLERVDNNKGYSPDNCIFATRDRQNNNKRNNRMIRAFGERKSMADWAIDPRCKVSYTTLRMRLNLGWDAEEAILNNLDMRHDFISAFGETKSVTDWAIDPRCKVNYNTLRSRIYQMHWDAEAAIITPVKRTCIKTSPPAG